MKYYLAMSIIQVVLYILSLQGNPIWLFYLSFGVDLLN